MAPINILDIFIREAIFDIAYSFSLVSVKAPLAVLLKRKTASFFDPNSSPIRIPMLMKKHLLLFCILLTLVLTCGCAKTKPTPPQQPQKTFTIEDERTFPQDINYYVKQVGANTRLLSEEDQMRANDRTNDIFFGTWTMTHAITKAGNACIRRARGYKLGGERWPQDEWDTIVANADIGNFPSLAQPSIVVRNTDLREMPTHQPRYDKAIIQAKSYPFDDFQYSLLPLGLPVFVVHESADKRWYFVETPLASGWVDSNDIAFVDDAFIQTWKNCPLGAITRDGVKVSSVGTPLTLGTLLPIENTKGKTITTLIPVQNTNRYASIRKIRLSSKDIQKKPIPLTASAMARMISTLYGQRYGWGGMYGLRDCSTTTHDLLVPFGIWLPRNSRPQAKTGLVVPLSGLSREEKEETIIKNGTPFLSLVGLPGHITMYVGTHNGRVAIIHNIWGLRTIEGENDNARHIIGKTIITSLTPGIEIPNLYRKRTFIDRINALATPGL